MKVDWSKHVVVKEQIDFCTIHTLWIPNSSFNMVRFINAGGICAVTGDFGNWIFCRQFIPHWGQYCDPSYWDEKLQIASQQKAHQYDPYKTDEAIKRRMNSSTCDPVERRYLNEVMEYVHENEMMYTIQAYNNLPDGYDHDTMIIEKSRHHWLDVVYDAYNEIVKRITNEAKETAN